MGFISYWRSVIVMAFRHSLDLAQLILFVVFLAAGSAALFVPPELAKLAPSVMEGLETWRVIAITCMAVFSVRLACAPYWIWKEQNAKLAAFDMPKGTAADLKLVDLFKAINPSVTETEDDWEVVGHAIKDQLSLGSLRAWGRKVDSADPVFRDPNPPLTEIDPSYWQSAEWSYLFFQDGGDREPHTYGNVHRGWPMPGTYSGKYSDIRVMNAEAQVLWPALLEVRTSKPKAIRSLGSVFRLQLGTEREKQQ